MNCNNEKLANDFFDLDNMFNNKLLVCNKGEMPLYSKIHNINKLKAYEMCFSINSIDASKLNIENLLGYNIYELLEKLNVDLIEKIVILKIHDNNKADIIIILKHIAKEVGIKQKYLMFRSSRIIDYDNNIVYFNNKDISLINEKLKNDYLNILEKDYTMKNFEPLLYNYGTIKIIIDNYNLKQLQNYNNNNNVNIKLDVDFQIITKDDLPIYMENIIGLMMKKIFYNLKLFIDKLK